MSDVGAEEMDNLKSQWPSASERLFVEAHPLRGAWAAKASDERLFRMIKGFHEAGDLLVAESAAEPHRAMNLLYPIMFSYRQSLELRLKCLLMAFGPIANEAPDFRHHGLKDLWAKCKRVILFFENDLRAEDRETFLAVGAQIGEFDAVDPGSDAFRFAHDTKGQPIELALSSIDLASLHKVVGSLHNFLECVDCHLRYGLGLMPFGH